MFGLRMLPLLIIQLLMCFFALVAESVGQNSATVGINNERNTYAAKMASYMNMSISPCEDFYEYACGNFFKIHKPKLGLPSYDFMMVMEDEMLEDFHNILTQPANTETSSISVTDKAKFIYQSCMKVDFFRYPKSETYLNLIKELGGWPVLDPNWKAKNFDWFKVISTMAGLNIYVFLDIILYLNGRMTFQPKRFGYEVLEWDKHPNSRIYKKNLALTTKILTMYGVAPEKSKQIFQSYVDLGIKFTELSRSSLDVKENTLEEIKVEFSEYDWENYFTELLGKEANFTTLIISVVNSNFLRNLTTFLQNNAETAANYIFTKFLYHMHDEFKQPQYQKEYCFLQVRNIIEPVVAAMYLNSKYYNSEVEDEIMEIALYIKRAMRNSIETRTWLDEDTRSRALKKLEDMNFIIGRVETILDLDKWEKVYADLNPVPHDIYQNKMIFRKRELNRKFSEFLGFSQKNESNIIPTTIRPTLYKLDVNAYSFVKDNQVLIPAGMIRRPMFYPELPMSYNFGSIGAKIIGHEIVHGYDNDQRLYYGMEDQHWYVLPSETYFGMDEHSHCIKLQYDNYRIPEINDKADGWNTREENIADNGGLRQAYFAYMKWLEDKQGLFDIEQETLSGLNLTNTQLFFLSYAQASCSQVKLKKNIIGKRHSIGRLRVIGSVSNFDEFSKAFECKEGSEMNPETKCILW